MSAAVKIDAFGFAEAASRISTTGLTYQVNQIAIDCYRSRGILRVLRLSLLNGNKDEVELSDIQGVIEAALAAMPNPEGESFNAIDNISCDVNQAVRSLLLRQENVVALLEAMEVARCMGSTLDELTKAATTAYGVVTLFPDGQRHWDAFCELIARRGLSVELIDLGPGFGPRPKIYTPESSRRSKAVQRKIEAQSAAVSEESVVRAPTRKPAKRSQGKA